MILTHFPVETDMDVLNLSETILQKLVAFVKISITDPERAFIEVGMTKVHLMYSRFEIHLFIHEVAVNPRAAYILADEGICDILFQDLSRNTRNDLEMALLGLWQLVKSETIGKVLGLQNLQGKLRELTNSHNEVVKQASLRLKYKVHELSKPSLGIGQQLRTTIKECEYAAACLRYINSLSISDDYLDVSFTMCYCATCHAQKGDLLYYTRGDPPEVYALPIGWFRVGLKASSEEHSEDAFEKWHRAFHSIKTNYVHKVLEAGNFSPGDSAFRASGIGQGHLKPDGYEELLLSPSIRYAGHEAHATPSRYMDETTNSVYRSKVAFQVLVKPQSYTVGVQRIAATCQVDPRFSNQELEWSTKERGSVILYGLLVKLEEVDDREDAIFDYHIPA